MEEVVKEKELLSYIKELFLQNGEEIEFPRKPNFSIRKKGNNNIEQITLYYDEYMLIIFTENGRLTTYRVMPIK